MPRLFNRLSLVPLAAGLTISLALTYVGLIAVVMSYATLHVEFTQEVRSDEASIAALEASYLATLSSLTATDYRSLGYEKPLSKRFVTGVGATALGAR